MSSLYPRRRDYAVFEICRASNNEGRTENKLRISLYVRLSLPKRLIAFFNYSQLKCFYAQFGRYDVWAHREKTALLATNCCDLKICKLPNNNEQSNQPDGN